MSGMNERENEWDNCMVSVNEPRWWMGWLWVCSVNEQRWWIGWLCDQRVWMSKEDKWDDCTISISRDITCECVNTVRRLNDNTIILYMRVCVKWYSALGGGGGGEGRYEVVVLGVGGAADPTSWYQLHLLFTMEKLTVKALTKIGSRHKWIGSTCRSECMVAPYIPTCFQLNMNDDAYLGYPLLLVTPWCLSTPMFSYFAN